MTEQSTSSSEKDWGNLRFTPRRGGYSQGSPEDNANSRFVIGLVVFVLVALLYPWYSYWVQARLVARDVTRAVEVMDAQLRSRSEEHTSELQSLMRISYAVFCLKKKTNKTNHPSDQ